MSSDFISRRKFLQSSSAFSLAGLLAPLNGLAGEGPYQIGCYTRPWDQFDYRVALDGIAEAGFRFAGLMTAKGMSGEMINLAATSDGVAAIAEEVKKRGLKTISIYGGAFPVAESVEAGVAGLRVLVDYCVICGCPNLLLGGTTDEKLKDSYYKVVSECCAYAASKGVGLSIKPHGGTNATGPECRKLIERIGHKNFRLWYDPGNIYYYSDGKLDPVIDSSTVDGLVVGMSIKDFLPPKEVQLTPGTGRVDFQKVMMNLRRGGFAGGPLVIECLKVGDSASVTAEAKKARKFVEELVASR